MNTLTQINKLALQNPKLLIKQAENNYQDTIAAVADRVLAREHCKIVLLSGPSGSGKTTTAHILCSRFAARGVQAAVVSLDHFYLPAAQMPKLENGDPDFETVYALDIPEIKQCFLQIIKSGKTKIPVFDFSVKKRLPDRLPIDVTGNKILIVEGLHALNPILTENLPVENLFKIYISVNSAVYRGEEILLSSRQLRLCRRLSRDFIYRSTNAAFTLKLWSSVVAGERKYLYCFKDTANLQLKTFHAFEPCVFAGLVPPLLENLPADTENYDYAMKTKHALEQFQVLPIELVPEGSLIREFIRGGTYEQVT